MFWSVIMLRRFFAMNPECHAAAANYPQLRFEFDSNSLYGSKYCAAGRPVAVAISDLIHELPHSFQQFLTELWSCGLRPIDPTTSRKES
jgi:hypothetical protein